MITLSEITTDGKHVWRYSECLHCLKEDGARQSVLYFFLMIGANSGVAYEILDNILSYVVCKGTYYSTCIPDMNLSVRVKGLDVEAKITV